MKQTIGIIGGGNMGAAIIRSVRKYYKVVLCEQNKRRARSLRQNLKIKGADIKDLAAQTRIIILAVKPQDSEEALKVLSAGMTGRHVLISIAAGLTTSFLEKQLGGKARVIRTMPNMPAQIGEGVTAISKGRYATRTDVQTARTIFKLVGQTVIVKESLLDAVTAVSGSGPAYVFLFAECLESAARSLGLSAGISRELVRAKLLGSVHLLNQSGENPATLRSKVTSKGGTTRAAMDVFHSKKLAQVYEQALKAAARRSKQLAQ